MRVFNGIDEFAAAVGSHLGDSEWVEVTQAMVDQFAEATGDHQWIHVDPERAAHGPFGTTVAHGYLTLSLVPAMISQTYRVDGLALALNYGSDKVRYPSPVPVGSRVRAHFDLQSLTPIALGMQAVTRVTVELEGSAKPACVAEVVSVLVPGGNDATTNTTDATTDAADPAEAANVAQVADPAEASHPNHPRPGNQHRPHQRRVTEQRTHEQPIDEKVATR
ncbi:acyl dehydratase [Kineosphaera limosa]|uniref:Putative acyl dehydratase n=1 Tax=Kineosphaera limosa NBRC 100340 TaxID=1184609 RepID=K6WRX7_9MICO|nr:MaoC family dehydratase [Kineosphaera limosa]NYE01192.1 acyl dehydratase [Kineosphaera limosa]GAB96606.1 putative acyl dehydratase [Kineosphaera limosa NBRC 100340]